MINKNNRIGRKLRQLRNDRQGIVAVFVALSVPILIGSVAFAIDFTNYRLVAGRLQAAADAGALAGVKALDSQSTTVNEAIKFVNMNVPTSFGNVTLSSDVTIGNYSKANGFVAGTGPTANAVRVQTVRTPQRGNAAKRIFSVFWGPDEISLQAQATAARQLNVQYEPPERLLLDNEAWDYNEMYAYCYDNNTKSRVANTETLIGNNIRLGVDKYTGENVTYNGKTIKKGATIMNATDIITISKGKINKVASDPIQWPECNKQGQSLSFRMRNIREVKQYPANWATASQYNYYTDTVISGGVETFPSLKENMLENVRCDTLDKCDPSKTGSTVPKGKNRTPVKETKPCLPGKYMYFGWEDRPPTSGSDKDYDDITMVMKCPKDGILGDGKTRLVG